MVYKGSHFFTTLSTLVYLLSFVINRHSEEYDVIAHCDFDLHFRDQLVMLSTFSCSCWPSVYLIWKNVYLGSLHIFSLDCIFCYCLFSHFWMSVSTAIIWPLYCHCVSGSYICLGWGSIRMADNFLIVFSFTSYQIKENHTQVIALRSITCTWTW